MIYGEKRKSVSFSLDKPQERELFELANSMQFATFVKGCLLEELRRRKPGRESIQVRME